MSEFPLRVWHLVIFRADQSKKPPCRSSKLTLKRQSTFAFSILHRLEKILFCRWWAMFIMCQIIRELKYYSIVRADCLCRIVPNHLHGSPTTTQPHHINHYKACSKMSIRSFLLNISEFVCWWRLFSFWCKYIALCAVCVYPSCCLKPRSWQNLILILLWLLVWGYVARSVNFKWRSSLRRWRRGAPLHSTGCQPSTCLQTPRWQQL